MAWSHVNDHPVANNGGTGNLTVTVDAVNKVTAGNTLILLVSAITSAVSTIGKGAGESASWVKLVGPHSTANGTSGEIWAIKTTVDWAAGSTFTVSFSPTLSGNALAILEEWGGGSTTVRAAGVTTTFSLVSTASLSDTSPVSGDLVIGEFDIGRGSAATFTDDSDTTNGSWSSSIRSTIGTNTTGMSLFSQYKVVTATGTQTFNPSWSSTGGGGSLVTIQPGATTTNVSTTRTFKWNTRTSLTITRTFLWKIIQTITLARILKWNTRAVLSGISRILKWNTRAAISKTSIFKWGVIQTITGTRSFKWNTRTTLSGITRTFTWNTRLGISLQDIFYWNVYVDWVTVSKNSAAWNAVSQNGAAWSPVAVNSTNWNEGT